ncbi:hypothetical protein ES708_15914 [subsurface metagenome]
MLRLNRGHNPKAGFEICKQLRLPSLYALLGVSLVVLCVGIVLLILHSC